MDVPLISKKKQFQVNTAAASGAIDASRGKETVLKTSKEAHSQMKDIKRSAELRFTFKDRRSTQKCLAREGSLLAQRWFDAEITQKASEIAAKRLANRTLNTVELHMVAYHTVADMSDLEGDIGKNTDFMATDISRAIEREAKVCGSPGIFFNELLLSEIKL